jgi:transcriptional regulator with XRE-family HTH domain
MDEPAATFSFKARVRFADNLYRARGRAGLLQENAAARAALTPARLDKIEGGEAIPSFDVLIRLASAYSVSIGELVEGVTWKPGWVEDSGPAEYLVTNTNPD